MNSVNPTLLFDNNRLSYGELTLVDVLRLRATHQPNRKGGLQQNPMSPNFWAPTARIVANALAEPLSTSWGVCFSSSVRPPE